MLAEVTSTPAGLADDLGRVLAAGVRLVYLRDHGRRTASAIAAAALDKAGFGVVGLDLRRLATLHCLIAWFFNAVILALTVNLAAALF